MASISWPTSGRISAVVQQDEGLEWDVEVIGYRNGRVTTSSLPGARWTCELWIPDDSIAYLTERRQFEALLVTLRGGAVRLNLWNLLTPTPRGTLQSGSPTVQSTIAAGATSGALTGLGSGTLLRGDRIQFGATGQRVMVTADATPSGGNATVSFLPAARAAISATVAVVYDKPYTQYILRDPRNVFPAQRNKLPGFGISLVEGSEV